MSIGMLQLLLDVFGPEALVGQALKSTRSVLRFLRFYVKPNRM